MGVRVAEDADPLLARRVELFEGHLFDLEVLAERGRECLLLGGIAEVGEEAVVAEDGEARVLERDERHQRVAVLALAADLVGVGARGLVAVVAVRDEELGSVELGLDGLDHGGVGDAPDAVDGAVGVGGLAPRLALRSPASRCGQAFPSWREKMGERLWRVAWVRRRRSSLGPG